MTAFSTFADDVTLYLKDGKVRGWTCFMLQHLYLTACPVLDIGTVLKCDASERKWSNISEEVSGHVGRLETFPSLQGWTRANPQRSGPANRSVSPLQRRGTRETESFVFLLTLGGAYGSQHKALTPISTDTASLLLPKVNSRTREHAWAHTRPQTSTPLHLFTAPSSFHSIHFQISSFHWDQAAAGGASLGGRPGQQSAGSELHINY